MRMKDFIGICSDGATTNDGTAKAVLEYTMTDYGPGGSIKITRLTIPPDLQRALKVWE